MTDPLASALARATEALGLDPDPSALRGFMADALAGAFLDERGAVVAAFADGLAAEARRGALSETALRARLEAAGHSPSAAAAAAAALAAPAPARPSRWREGAVAVARSPQAAVLAAERAADGRIRRIGVILPDRGSSRYLEGSRTEAPRLLAAVGDLPVIGVDLPAIAADLESLGLRSRLLADLHETADWLAATGRLGTRGDLGLDALAAAVGLPAPLDLRNRTAATGAVWLTLLRPAVPV